MLPESWRGKQRATVREGQPAIDNSRYYQVVIEYGELLRALFLALANRQIQPDREGLTWLAAQTGMEPESFDVCLREGRYEDNIRREYRDAVEAGVRGTPTLEVYGRLLEWKDYRDLRRQLNERVELYDGRAQPRR